VAAQTFRSAVDTWLLAVMLGTPIVVLASVIPVLPRETAPLAVVVLVAVVSVGLPIWLLATTRYELSSDALRVVSGPFRWTVTLCDIKSITPTRSPLASPALSLRRLEIRYGVYHSIMVSPADQEGFLRALEQRRSAAV
jgi:membrane protein YdbS with pleckstrin-like domain